MTELLRKIKFPKVGMRIYKTLASVLIVTLAYEFLLDNRNPCFACIGAVFGMGTLLRDGMKFGGNRFIGTLLGGLVVILDGAADRITAAVDYLKDRNIGIEVLAQ